MKVKKWKVVDNSGARRRGRKLKLTHRRNDGDVKPGEIVLIDFDDEYIRNGCSPKVRKEYRVEKIWEEDETDRRRGMCSIELTRVEGGEK